MKEYLSLKEYDDISVKFLRKHRIEVNDENVSFVNENMMKADMVYDQDKTEGSKNYRSQFRRFYANFACLNIKRKYYNESNYKSLYNKNQKLALLREDVECKKETPYQKVSTQDLFVKAIETLENSSNNNCVEVFKLCIMDKVSVTEASKILNISYEAVRKIINSLPRKLKDLRCHL